MRALFAILLFAISFLLPLCGQMATSAAVSQPIAIELHQDDDPAGPPPHLDLAPNPGACDGDAPCIGVFPRQYRPSTSLQERLFPAPGRLPPSAHLTTEPHPPRPVSRT